MIWHGLIIIALTALTQLGGLAWGLALLLRMAFGRFLLSFLIVYLGLTVVAHYTAPLAGREPLPCLDAGPNQIAVLNPLYCALNRHYVNPAMKAHADALSAHIHESFPGTRTRALDASFPFIDGFAMLPHLSHDDGNKLDLAFYYTDQHGEYRLGQTKSFIGYWGFEQPGPGDPQPCASDTGISLRWDVAWAQPYLRDWPLDAARTGEALRWLADNPVGNDYKIFVEPYLAERLGVSSDTIRFQGCSAARHDDHIHLEFNPG
ncbi:hypothetical protein SLH49_09725 [Cognatiyoonia sp. IB215446]|uniref:hypothetical protein n=1 Tax=Cognatiyoonia sp. IB215446 TaxID=3097355 RepID=UPI002A131BA4|nr:hypothetical protein [Cognatiyoonia sp. IB215446]MDX8348266.1 hypothetical protein [Cognatiyoonia sp. IB215446]